MFPSTMLEDIRLEDVYHTITMGICHESKDRQKLGPFDIHLLSFAESYRCGLSLTPTYIIYHNLPIGKETWGEDGVV